MTRTVWDDLKVERDWVVTGGRERGYKKILRIGDNIYLRFGNPETGSLKKVTEIFARTSDESWHEESAGILQVSFNDPIPLGVKGYRLYVIDNPDP